MRRVVWFLVAGTVVWLADEITRFLTESFDKIDEACRLG